MNQRVSHCLLKVLLFRTPHMQHSALLRTFTSENLRKRSKKCGDICASEVVGRGDKIVAASARATLAFPSTTAQRDDVSLELKRARAHFLSANSIRRRRSPSPSVSGPPPTSPQCRAPTPRLSSRYRRRTLARLFAGGALEFRCRRQPTDPGPGTPPARDCLCYCAATAAASKRTSCENYEPVKRDKLSSFLFPLSPPLLGLFPPSSSSLSLASAARDPQSIHRSPRAPTFSSIDRHRRATINNHTHTLSLRPSPLSLSVCLSIYLMKSPTRPLASLRSATKSERILERKRKDGTT